MFRSCCHGNVFFVCAVSLGWLHFDSVRFCGNVKTKMASVADKVVSATGAVPIKVTLFADSRFFSAKLDRALASLQDTLVRLEETRGGENGKVYTLVSFRIVLVFCFP